MREAPPRGRLGRVLRILLGVTLIPLGIVGLFLPVLQGVLFLVLGLALLADEVPFLARLRDRLRSRYPRPWAEADRLSLRMKAWARQTLRRNDGSGDEERGR